MGKQIKTLNDLMVAALGRRSVVVPSSRCFKAPLPAAFVINQQAGVVHRLILQGMFIYERGRNPKWPILTTGK